VSSTPIYSHAMQPLQAVSLYGGKQQWALGTTWGQGLKLWATTHAADRRAVVQLVGPRGP